MTAEDTTLRGAARETPAGRLCFGLLAACVPAAMLPVVMLPEAVQVYLRTHLPRLYALYAGIAPGYPSWPEYFALQTLAAAIAVCGAYLLLSRRPAPRPGRSHVFAMLVGAYAVWSAASYLWSVWPYGTRAWVIGQLPFWFLAVVASLVCTTRRRALTIARLFLAASLVAAAVTVVVLLAAVHAHPVWSMTTAFLEKPIFFQNKNFSCALMLTAAYVAVGLALRQCLARRRTALAVAAGLAAVCLLGYVFVTAGALAGWVALGVSAPAYALCVLPIRRKGLIVAARGRPGRRRLPGCAAGRPPARSGSGHGR